MLTKTDISKLKEIFATKDDLKRFATKDDILTFKDVILKEIRDMRDEVALVSGQRDMLEDHEIRIETVEKQLHIAPAS